MKREAYDCAASGPADRPAGGSFAHRSVNEYRTLFEHASDAIVIFEPDSEVILDANATACEMYGYAHHELVELSLKTLTEDVARGEDALARLQRDGRIRNHRATHRRRDGQPFHVLATATLVEYQGRQAVMSIVRDVEEAFAAEEERRRLVRDLGERVKELTLLHRAARLCQNPELDLPAILERLVALLPQGWSHSHLAAASVTVGSFEYRTVNWADTDAVQQVVFDTREGPGLLQVAYPGPSATPDGPLFLTEEQQVLESLADMLRASIDQRAAEREVRRSEEYFRSLVENASDAITVISLDGTIMFTSRSAQRVTGYFAEGLVGLSAFRYVHPDDLDRVKGLIGRALENGEPQRTELRVRTADGGWRHLEAIGSPLREGDQVVGFVVNARDVTERREAEDAVRAERAFRQAIEDSLLAGLSVVGRDGRLTYVNPALCEMVGWSEAELIGLSAPLPYWSTDDRERMQHTLDAIMAGRLEQRSFEARYQRKNGELLDVLVIPSILRDADGTVKGWLAAIYDITDRKRLEEQFRQAQKMEAVGRLAGGVAHDFNNLLTAILGYTELAVDTLGSEHPAAADLAEVRKAGESATRLVSQLLGFSRRQVVELKAVDLNAVARNVEGMLRRVIGEDVALVVDLDRKVPLIEADTGQIEQVIMNLAVNARDAMPDGGRLSLRTSAVVVDEPLAQHLLGLQPGPYARLTVQDSGTGMSTSVRSHLFEPFFTTKPKGKGTGLGLATVYGIVTQAGGRIDVQSASGEGTTFHLYLPAARAANGAAAPAPGGVTASTGHVLLVEDEDAVRGLARRILVDAGFEVSDGTAEAALAMARQPGARFDLLLTDVVMPDMSGGELAARFAELHPTTPVLFMTGYTEDQIVRAGVSAGSVPLVRKPFTSGSLLDKVVAVLAESRPARAQLPPTGR